MAAGWAASLRVKSETVIIPLAIIPAAGSPAEHCALANPFFAAEFGNWHETWSGGPWPAAGYKVLLFPACFAFAGSIVGMAIASAARRLDDEYIAGMHFCLADV